MLRYYKKSCPYVVVNRTLIESLLAQNLCSTNVNWFSDAKPRRDLLGYHGNPKLDLLYL